MASQESPPLWKTLLDLGRVSNLPTVWTNCLAGWILGGGGEPKRLALLLVSGSLIYVAGMYLNDAFDARWDSEHKNDRPIPSGFIGQRPVWIMGWSMMMAGLGLFVVMGKEPAILGALLASCVIFYDAFHKQISWSPIPMALCRLFLLLAAAASARGGVDGYAVWCSVVLASYIVGLSYLAKAESLPGMLRYWPLIFLAAPIVLAVIVNDGDSMEKGLVASLILALWILKSLRVLLWSDQPSVGRAVCGLLAGICLVDLLAVAVVPPGVAVIFLGAFVMCLILQRSIAAT